MFQSSRRALALSAASVAAAGAATAQSIGATTVFDDCESLHAGIRATPLVELKCLSRALGCRVVAKAEMLHPGGSVKDRAAHFLVASVEASGELQPGGTVVQPSGGNTGISLAMVCAAKGYKAHITIPENISPNKIALLRMFGADVTICKCVPFSDPTHYAHMAKTICAATPGAVLPDQFENVHNARAHFETTGPETWRQAGGRVDAFVCAAGTGGTIAGVGRFLKSVNPRTKVFLIDPTGSGLKSFVETGRFASSGGCFIDGVGIMRETANFKTASVDGAFRGTDREAVEMAYW
jgi:cysteine synthase A